MKLTRVSGTNFMGASFGLELGDLNIIYGPNLSGKTRVRRGVELSLLGYSPALDKTPKSIFKLASGRKMEVEAHMTEEIAAHDKQLHFIHRSWETKDGTVKAKHHVPLGLDGKTPLVMLDAGDYFSRSARGRVELVFASAQVIAVKPSEFIKQIFDKLGTATAGMVCGRTAMHDGMHLTEVVNILCETAEQLRSEAAANVRRYGGTIQGLSALQLDDKAPQRALEVIDAEIDGTQRGIGRLQINKKAAELAQSTEEVNELERERLAHLIAEAGDPVPREFDIDALRVKETRLGGEIHRSHLFRLEHDLWQDRRLKFEDDLQTAYNILDTAKNSVVDRRVDREEECPECGQKIIRTEADVVLEIKSREAEREIEIHNAQKWVEELLMRRQEQEPTRPENTMVQEAELKAVRADIDEYTRTADVQVWRKQLAALEPKLTVANTSPSEYATLIEMAEEQITKLREERRLAESDRNDRKRLAEARREHEKALADEERYKAAKKFLLEKKEELIGQVFGPLLATVNALTQGIARAPFKYVDGEFGYSDYNKWITEATFSGTEQALLYASLQAALGSQSPCRIVMVDELGRLDKVNFLRFLLNVRAAKEAGRFDQFIGFTPRMEHEEQLKGIGFTLVRAAGNSYSTI